MSGLSVSEAARVVRKSPETVRRAVRSGALRASRFGERGWYEIDEADLRAFVVKSGKGGASEAGSSGVVV
jgi:excisionase family DNA binding protein